MARFCMQIDVTCCRTKTFSDILPDRTLRRGGDASRYVQMHAALSLTSIVPKHFDLQIGTFP
jgi:hypothetical protein